MNIRELSYEEWIKEAKEKFGDDPLNWRFVCPGCGHIASVLDWKNIGATEGEVAFSCVGRHMDNPKEFGVSSGPCNYAGGGLIRLNSVHVKLENGSIRETFEFASV